MTKELWKPVKGYEGLYEVSNTGKVRSLDRTVSAVMHGKRIFYQRKGRMMASHVGSQGYWRTSVCKDGVIKMRDVHRIVAEAFIPNPNNFECVNHIDEDKLNNCVENLEWCTREYNSTYGTKQERELQTKGVRPFLCVETGKVYTNQHECAMELNIGQSAISRVLRKVQNHTGGYHFEYADASLYTV